MTCFTASRPSLLHYWCCLLPTSPEDLEALDQSCIEIINAITLGDPEDRRQTRTRPFTVIAEGGGKYWVKSTAKCGLVSELVCGRLADLLGCGSPAVVMGVDQSIVPPDRTGEFANPDALYVGILHLPDSINLREVSETMLRSKGLPPESIDGRSRAAVVAFQSWIGLGDNQVMVGLSNGRVYSIDHEDTFNNLKTSAPLDLIVTGAAVIPDVVGKEPESVENTIIQIENLQDNDLLGAVSKVPSGTEWNADPDRRLQIADWLSARKKHLRGVMESWAQT